MVGGGSHPRSVRQAPSALDVTWDCRVRPPESLGAGGLMNGSPSPLTPTWVYESEYWWCQRKQTHIACLVLWESLCLQYSLGSESKDPRTLPLVDFVPVPDLF